MSRSSAASAPVAVLRSTYRPREGAPSDAEWFGTFEIEVQAVEGSQLTEGMKLALWCTMLLEPTADSGVDVVERLAGRLVLTPSGGRHSADRWTIPGLRSTFPARHANDGPEAAYLVNPLGEMLTVRVIPAVRDASADSAPTSSGDDVPPDGPHMHSTSAHPTSAHSRPPLVPYPTRLTVEGGGGGHQVLHLAADSARRPEAVAAWNTVRDLAGRLTRDDARSAFAPLGDGDGDGAPVHIEIAADIEQPTLGREGYRFDVSPTGVRLVAASEAGVRHGLITLAQWGVRSLPLRAGIVDRPSLTFRGVHIDLARRWYEPGVVERLIDLASWRKLNHVHLHLTDDEGWRFPVEGYPQLADVGGTRGHGLALPPLCASGPERSGRAYTAAEIGRWVSRAHALGVTLIPEVDVPGHCHAALAAVPTLRDPEDTSAAVSVQGYPNNVLVPGHPETTPFLRAVFTSLASLFAHSPTLHIGGDEVPVGAWAGSPIVAAYAERRGLGSTREIEAAFHADVIEMIRAETGRDVAMWEEAALSGVAPAAYAVSWTSAAAGQRVRDGGHRVVIAPGQAYYLDMATGSEWDLPGASWAGHAPLEVTCGFDPLDGFDRPDDVHGVQACIWSEHVADIDTLDQLVFPRLDAVAERAWTGEVVGGAGGLSTRAASLPTFVAG